MRARLANETCLLFDCEIYLCIIIGLFCLLRMNGSKEDTQSSGEFRSSLGRGIKIAESVSDIDSPLRELFCVRQCH